jgi:hypothetical protein
VSGTFSGWYLVRGWFLVLSEQKKKKEYVMTRKRFAFLWACIIFSTNCMGMKPFIFGESSLERMRPGVFAKKLTFLKRRGFRIRYQSPRAKKLAQELIKKMGAPQFRQTGWTLKDLGIDPAGLRKIKVGLEEELKKYKLTLKEFEKLVKDYQKKLGKKEKEISGNLEQELEDLGLTVDEFKDIADKWKRGILVEKEEELEEEDDDDVPPPPDDDDEEELLTFEKEKKEPPKKKPEEPKELKIEQVQKLTAQEKQKSDKLLLDALRILSDKTGKFGPYMTIIKEYLYKNVRKKEAFKKREAFDKSFGKGKTGQGDFQKFLDKALKKKATPFLSDTVLDDLYKQLTGQKTPVLINEVKKRIASCLFDSQKIKNIDIDDAIKTIIINLAVGLRSVPTEGMYDSSDAIAEGLLADFIEKEGVFANVLPDRIGQLIREINYLRVHPDFFGFNKVFGKMKKIGGPIINLMKDPKTRMSFKAFSGALRTQLFFETEDFDEFIKEGNNEALLKQAFEGRLVVKLVDVPAALLRIKSLAGLRAFLKKLKMPKYARIIKEALKILHDGTGLNRLIVILRTISGDPGKVYGWENNIKKIVATEWKKGALGRKIRKAFMDVYDMDPSQPRGNILYRKLISIPEIKTAIEKSFKNPFRTPDTAIAPIRKYLVADTKIKKMIQDGQHYKIIEPIGLLLTAIQDIETNKAFLGQRIRRLVDVLKSLHTGRLQTTAKDYDLLKKNIELIKGAYGQKTLGQMALYAEHEQVKNLINLLVQFAQRSQLGFDKIPVFQNIMKGLVQMFKIAPIEKVLEQLMALNQGKVVVGRGAWKTIFLPVLNPVQKKITRQEKRFRRAVLRVFKGQASQIIAALNTYLQALKTSKIGDKKGIKTARDQLVAKLTEKINKLTFKRDPQANQRKKKAIQAIKAYFDFAFLKM